MNWETATKEDAPERVYKQFTTEKIEVVDETGSDRTVKFTITTDDVDRERDIIDPAGVDTSDFEKNPVVMFAHSHHDLPIGKAVHLSKQPGKIEATVEFATEGQNPQAERVFQLVKGGFLNATSIGFRPLEWVFNEERRGVDFTAVELLEFSIVPVPANAHALIANTDKGVDAGLLKRWADEILKGYAPVKLDDDDDDGKGVEATGSDWDNLDFDARAVRAREFAETMSDVGDDDRAEAFCVDRDGVEEKTGLAIEDVSDGKLASMLNAHGYTREARSLAIRDVLSGDGLRDDDAFDQAVEDAVELAMDGGVEKSGRSLSKANEKKLRSAASAVESAAVELASVLEGVTASLDDGGKTSDDDDDDTKDTGDGFVLRLVEAPEPEFEIDEQAIKDAIATAVNDTIAAEVREAVGALTGRVS